MIIVLLLVSLVLVKQRMLGFLYIINLDKNASSHTKTLLLVIVILMSQLLSSKSNFS